MMSSSKPPAYVFSWQYVSWMVVQTFFMFIPTCWNDPNWRAYFSDGLVQPPTSYVSLISWFSPPYLVCSDSIFPNRGCLKMPWTKPSGIHTQKQENIWNSSLYVCTFWIFLTKVFKDSDSEASAHDPHPIWNLGIFDIITVVFAHGKHHSSARSNYHITHNKQINFWHVRRFGQIIATYPCRYVTPNVFFFFCPLPPKKKQPETIQGLAKIIKLHHLGGDQKNGKCMVNWWDFPLVHCLGWFFLILAHLRWSPYSLHAPLSWSWVFTCGPHSKFNFLVPGTEQGCHVMTPV